ncbi:MAG: hypothetical protein CM15mP109_09490 [Candidatus Dadabacteria bacterium]|nr:MAG: hypothetical protein CM15mP109_09490 [Candidatus Dadabacteria bacterium]
MMILFLQKNETKNFNLDQGNIGVAEKVDDKWIINQWVKKTILPIFSYQ